MWQSFLILIAIFVLSALPLYFSVKLLGGKARLLTVIIVNVFVAFASFLINYFFQTWGGLLAFVFMILVYKELFRLGAIRALLAWLLQFVFAALILLILVIIFGVSILVI